MSNKLPEHGFFVLIEMDEDVGYHVFATRGHFRDLKDAKDYCKTVQPYLKPVIVSSQSLLVLENEWYRKAVWTDQ
mgnify:CR=1 FL=1